MGCGCYTSWVCAYVEMFSGEAEAVVCAVPSVWQPHFGVYTHHATLVQHQYISVTQHFVCVLVATPSLVHWCVALCSGVKSHTDSSYAGYEEVRFCMTHIQGIVTASQLIDVSVRVGISCTHAAEPHITSYIIMQTTVSEACQATAHMNRHLVQAWRQGLRAQPLASHPLACGVPLGLDFKGVPVKTIPA
jgi:hypothetical protein